MTRKSFNSVWQCWLQTSLLDAQRPREATMSRIALWTARFRHLVQIAVLSASVFPAHWAAADVIVSHQDQLRSPTVLLISGTITKGDIPVVAAALSSKKASVPEVMVFLDSGGGDVDAAMEIGRLIRKKVSVAGAADKMALVLGTAVASSPHEGTATYCASACILILCAAEERLGGLRVGIHRPYSVRLGPSADWTATAAYASVAIRLKDYLQDMGMPAQLFEEMMRVPAETVRWLSGREQVAFGLSGLRTAVGGSTTPEMVAELGPATRDFLQQKARAAKACPGRSDSLGCLN